MGRPKALKKGMFSVPRISSTIKKRSFVPRIIEDGFIQREEPKKKLNTFEIPKVQMSPKRAGLLKRLLESGRIKRSDKTFKELQLRAVFPELVHTEVDCLDEADLRSRFPKQGVNHKFFSTGVFRFEFCLPTDSDNVVVAQVFDNHKVRMPNDL
jgi:hypothetical protein